VRYVSSGLGLQLIPALFGRGGEGEQARAARPSGAELFPMPALLTTPSWSIIRSMLVFVSHAHADADAVGDFVDMLLTAGAVRGDIYCTSISGLGVALGSAFDRDIHRMLTDAKLVLALLSKAYFTSPYCMTELGGAWALETADKRVLPLLLPTLSAGELHGPIKHRISRSVRDRGALDEMWTVVSSLRPPAEPGRWHKARDAFLELVEKRYRGRDKLAQVRTVLERDVSLTRILAVLRVEELGGKVDGIPAAGRDGRNLPFFFEIEVGKPVRSGEVTIQAAFDAFADDVLLCYESKWLWADEENPRSGRHWRVFNQLADDFLKEKRQRQERALGMISVNKARR
jgi:hypothetical protein